MRKLGQVLLAGTAFMIALSLAGGVRCVYAASHKPTAHGRNARALRYSYYANARYRYIIWYPVGLLVPQGESDDGDGQVILSKRSGAKLTVYGSNNINDDTLRSMFIADKNGGIPDHPHGVFTYSVFRPTWYVLSGRDAGTLFYEKVIYRKDTSAAHVDWTTTMIFEYPERLKALYSPIVAHVSQSFQSIRPIEDPHH